MESEPIVYISVMLIALTVIGAISVYYNIMNFGEWFIGISTIILGMVTYRLVSTEVSEGKKRRQIERLRERLDGLYSPLMGLGKNFEKVEYHWLSPTLNIIRTIPDTMVQLRFVYNYLASDALGTLLDNYYSHNETAPLEITETELQSLRVQFTADYEEITKEYRELTISAFEEKRRAEIMLSLKKTPKPR